VQNIFFQDSPDNGDIEDVFAEAWTAPNKPSPLREVQASRKRSSIVSPQVNRLACGMKRNMKQFANEETDDLVSFSGLPHRNMIFSKCQIDIIYSKSKYVAKINS